MFNPICYKLLFLVDALFFWIRGSRTTLKVKNGTWSHINFIRKYNTFFYNTELSYSLQNIYHHASINNFINFCGFKIWLKFLKNYR
jgi:hypothetical protein